MKDTESIQRTLYLEMRNRLLTDGKSIPERVGDYYYSTKWKPKMNYPIYTRYHKTQSEEDEMIILNPNELANKYSDYSGLLLNSMKVCMGNQNYLVITIDVQGDEVYKALIYNITTKELYTTHEMASVYSVEWGTSTEFPVLYYTKPNAFHRPYQVYRHVINSTKKKDELVRCRIVSHILPCNNNT